MQSREWKQPNVIAYGLRTCLSGEIPCILLPDDEDEREWVDVIEDIYAGC